MNLEERLWQRLLADIQGKQVIPVIGPELLIVEVDGKPISLFCHLARQLVERLDLATDNLPPNFGYAYVVSEFLAQQPTHPAHYEKDEIYYKLREIIDEKAWPTPEPLKQLAAITHFDLFASTTFDVLMEQALNEVRFAGTPRCRSFAYCKREKITDLPNDFAVTDEDILQYASRLQSRDYRPHNLFDQLRDKRLLTLGYSFPG